MSTALTGYEERRRGPYLPDALRSLLTELLGGPVRLSALKHKQGRRLTLRAGAPRTSAIVKLYASDRAPRVAARVAALANGPVEPLVPELLLVAPEHRAVVLSDVPGVPLGEALRRDDGDAARRAGAALGAWHGAWARASLPAALSPHSPERELALLEDRAGRGGPLVAEELHALADAPATWTCSTVVHRDLYEEQVLLGARVGLIDLDDAALGPPELDTGNLLAHLDLLGLRTGRDTSALASAFIEGYGGAAALDGGLLAACRRLALLRLAFIHARERTALLRLVAR